MRPPLFFCLAKRKVAAAAVEKKSAFIQTCASRKFGEYGSQLFCSKTCFPPCAARAGCNGYPVPCPALMELQTSGCKEDALCSSSCCCWPHRKEPGSAERSGERGKRSWSNSVLQPDVLRIANCGHAVFQGKYTSAAGRVRQITAAVRDGQPLVLGELAASPVNSSPNRLFF